MRPKSEARSAAIEDAKALAARKGVSIAQMLTKPDIEVRRLLARASEAGATHDIERLASSKT